MSPVITESALRTLACESYIEASQIKHSGQDSISQIPFAPKVVNWLICFGLPGYSAQILVGRMVLT